MRKTDFSVSLRENGKKTKRNEARYDNRKNILRGLPFVRI